VKRGAASAALLALLGLSPLARASATFVIENVDEGTGLGLDDQAPRSPVGGNVGATLGQQRLLALQHALDIWSEVLTSDQTIVVNATFADLSGGTCDGSSLVLGQASTASGVARQAPGTSSEVWYPVALASALDGEDFYPDYPDIFAEFNTAVDEDCIPGSAWYYGFDGKHGDDSDFVMVALHELGHGLGFASFAAEDGSHFDGTPDLFSLFEYDLDAQKSWIEMTNEERAASGVNGRGLVWAGEHTQQAARDFLVSGSPELTVSPAIEALSGKLSEQVLGPRLPPAGISGTLVVANPISGCEAPTNAAALAGAIAIVDPFQGGPDCFPLLALVSMEIAGAKAVLAVDPYGQDPPEPIWGEYPADYPQEQRTPVFSITLSDGDLLLAAAGSTVTVKPSADLLVGADADDRPYLFASNPYNPGSTVSHWDTFARQNLLMEPTLTPDLVGTDITRYLLQDLGWHICGDGALEGDEECDDGNALSRDGCSPSCEEEICGDAVVNQESEECDDGNTTAADGCSSTCQKEVCGDAVVNQTSEECDDGNTAARDGCSSTCEKEVCGDGIVNLASEQCDDGNSAAADGCENDCTLTPSSLPGSGGSAGSGNGGSGGSAGSGPPATGGGNDDDSGCLCSSVGRRQPAPGSLALLLGLGLCAALRRR
jgi:cysteine-rich repeat protein